MKALKTVEKRQVCKISAISTIDFTPSIEQLVTQSLEQLEQLHISSIYHKTSDKIYSLTFVFSDGTRSPPIQSYEDECT